MHNKPIEVGAGLFLEHAHGSVKFSRHLLQFQVCSGEREKKVYY